ncbi:hypothetical protein NCCP2716_12920 [Sporosarcina sp. NCCP-2716]|uniref:hypothetical protein n=1 Tax=Sporosarcina sp. NCCP-2716 TaxID=2943679 RepID=UPI00203DD5B0|nr:hypothetical protein [Sporosarcina sp. NCCP-2716]GKV68794.1 hypothetical protein NCCP2716_12920 [Sporosarcina sp. NCCP-2716]
MTPYLFLLLLTLLVAGVVFWFVRTDRLPTITLWIVLLGASTAFLAMLVAQTMSVWYALLVIIGLSLATAVLLAKRQAEQ